MPIEKIECRIGGKIPKQKIRMAVSKPYDRPPKQTECRIWRPREDAEKEGGGWFSKIFDSASRFFVRTVDLFSSSFFGKRIGDSSGENANTIQGEVSTMKSSFEMIERGENTIDITLSIRYDGSEASMQRIISNIDTIFQLKEQPNQIHKENFDSPVKIFKENFESSFEIDSSNIKSELQKTIIKPRGKSSLYKMCRCPNFGSSMNTIPKIYYPPSSNIVRSNTSSFGYRQALKRRRSSNGDIRRLDDIRRVRQKSCKQDLNSSTNACQQQNKSRNYSKPLLDVLYASPPKSIETANKIMHELDIL